MAGGGTESTVEKAQKSQDRSKTPRRFRVVLHNDDYTTMDFVVLVLKRIFKKSEPEAVRIMLDVHHKGAGLCGIYTKQVAETRIAAVHKQAQDAGYPLRCSMEPER